MGRSHNKEKKAEIKNEAIEARESLAWLYLMEKGCREAGFDVDTNLTMVLKGVESMGHMVPFMEKAILEMETQTNAKPKGKKRL